MRLDPPHTRGSAPNPPYDPVRLMSYLNKNWSDGGDSQCIELLSLSSFGRHHFHFSCPKRPCLTRPNPKQFWGVDPRIRKFSLLPWGQGSSR